MEIKKYTSSFSGKEMDEGLFHILGTDLESYAWKILESSKETPVDLDTVLEPGNYIAENYINGLPGIEISPLSFYVYTFKSNIIQLILINNDYYTREYDGNTFISNWGISAKASTIYKNAEPPASPIKDMLWLKEESNQEGFTLYQYNGVEWKIVGNTAYMKKSVYDKNNHQMNIDTYLQNQINANSITFDSRDVIESESLNYEIKKVVYGLNKFVSLAYDNTTQIYYIGFSPNGLTEWNFIDAPKNETWVDIKFAANYFFLISNTNKILFSEIGTEWNLFTAVPNIKSMFAINRFAIFFTSSNKVYITTDLDKFTIYNTTFIQNFIVKGLVFAKNRYYACGTLNTNDPTNKLYYSNALGNNWTEVTLPSNGVWNNIIYGNGHFFVFGDTISSGVTKHCYHSTDGINWDTIGPDLSGLKTSFVNGIFFDSSQSTNQNIIRYFSKITDTSANFKYINLDVNDVVKAGSMISLNETIYFIKIRDNKNYVNRISIKPLNTLTDEHLNNIDIHINAQKRIDFNNKINPVDFANKIKTFKSTQENGIDIDIQETGIDNANDLIQDDLITMASHDTNTSLHINSEERILWDSKSDSTHTHNLTGNVKIKMEMQNFSDGINDYPITGLLDISRLPDGALERVITVDSDEARFRLTINQCQNGDVIHVYDEENDINEWYKVIDDTILGIEGAFLKFTPKQHSAIEFNNITGRPTTVADYGIENLYNNEEIEEKYNQLNDTAYRKIMDSIDEFDRQQMYQKSTITISDEFLNKIVKIDNKYIALTSTGNILESTNGIDWEIHYIGFSSNLTDIAFYNNIYVITSDGGVIYDSNDFNLWNKRVVSGILDNFNTVIHDGTRFIASGNNSSIAVSTDGINWTKVTLSPFRAIDFSCMKYNNGPIKYIAGHKNSMSFYVSDDFINWTQYGDSTTIIAGEGIRDIIYHNGSDIASSGFILVGTQGKIIWMGNNTITKIFTVPEQIRLNTITKFTLQYTHPYAEYIPNSSYLITDKNGNTYLMSVDTSKEGMFNVTMEKNNSVSANIIGCVYNDSLENTQLLIYSSSYIDIIDFVGTEDYQNPITELYNGNGIFYRKDNVIRRKLQNNYKDYFDVKTKLDSIISTINNEIDDTIENLYISADTYKTEASILSEKLENIKSKFY